MSIKFSGNGSFFLTTNDNKSMLFDGGISYIEEIEISDNEIPPVTLSLKQNRSASFSCENSCFNLELLDKHFNTFTPKEFDLECDRYIMIQARWHKKKRVNKKWLKRYGMKLDTVKVIYKSSELTYLPDGEFEFDVHNKEYILKQHQKRKHLKIEW